VDRAVIGCTGAHLRNRLELARAKMNHLHSFLVSFPEARRLFIVSAAYSNASNNRDNVIMEKEFISAHRQITIQANEDKVI
jgi:hypothetical protein